MDEEMVVQICDKLAEILDREVTHEYFGSGLVIAKCRLNCNAAIVEILNNGKMYVCAYFSTNLADPNCFEKLAEVLTECAKHSVCPLNCKFWY